MRVWNLGDRVARRVFLDDGTWFRDGDRCLERSPMRYGEVVATVLGEGQVRYGVRWDVVEGEEDGKGKAGHWSDGIVWYLGHGLESANGGIGVWPRAKDKDKDKPKRRAMCKQCGEETGGGRFCSRSCQREWEGV